MSPNGIRTEWSERIFIGMGSNLGMPSEQIDRATTAISMLPRCHLVACSSLYRSTPLATAGEPQPDYINRVIEVASGSPPDLLLGQLQGIEAASGRQRSGARWDPRTLDLDLLLYGERKIDEVWLTVPHPEVLKRNFVLIPLHEIAPTLKICGGFELRELIASLSGEGCYRL